MSTSLSLSVPGMNSFPQKPQHLSISSRDEYMNVQTPCAKIAGSQLCFFFVFFCTLDKGQGVVSWEGDEFQDFMNLNTNAYKARAQLKETGGFLKKLINAYKEVAELFITSALLSICSCHLVLL